MRVAIFSTAYFPHIGGAEVAIKEITDRIKEVEFDLFTVKLSSGIQDREKIGNLNIYRLGGGKNSRIDKILFPWRARRVVLKKHNKNPYNLFHAVMANYAGLAAWLCKRSLPNIPYLLNLQSGDSDLFIWARTWFWYPVYKKIYQQADKITAISTFLKQRAKNYGYQGEVKIIPNGVGVEKFAININEQKRNFIRESWGLSNDDFVIITTSRLVYKNGVDILINSLSYLPDDVKIVVVGVGQDEVKLKNIAANYKDRVIFLGQIEHDSLPKILQAADMFSRASRSEGLGISFLEAMAAGLPVVATEVGGIVDFLNNGSTGLSVKPNNAKALAGAIKKIKKNPSLASFVRNNARQLVQEKYNWDMVALLYKNLYKSLAK